MDLAFTNLSTFPTPTCGSRRASSSVSRWDRVLSWTVLESDGSEYFLRSRIVRSTYYFSTDSNPDPNIVIVILALPRTGPAASPLPARPPPRPHGGVGHGSVTSNTGDLVDVLVVVVYAVFFFIPVPEVDNGLCLWEAEGYPHVDHQPGILVVVIFSPRPPPASMLIVLPDAPSPPPLGRRKRRARQGRHRPPHSPVRASERLPAVRGGVRG